MPSTTASSDPLAITLPRPYVPAERVPHIPQHAFLALDDLDIEEAFYGGAAGGGKSDALLMAALRYVHVPGYAALILRKTYADLALPGAIMDRAKTWLAPTPARWNDIEKRFSFPSTASLSFGYLQTSNDKYRYQGAEFQFIGFDELTQFEEADYLYLSSRLRRPSDGPLANVPLRLRAASNPGGRGHRWVKRRFIDRLPNPDDPQDTPAKCRKRAFIPARLKDNPSVDRAAYEQQLAGLDPQTRAQLLDGDWNARDAGNWVFDNLALDAATELGAQLDQQLRNGSIPPPMRQTLACGVDWGDFRSHAVAIWELERGGIYVPPGEVATTQQDVEDISRLILESLGRFDYWFGEERYDASFKQSNRTFARTAEQLMGPHNAIRRAGRPNTVPVAFGTYKSLCVSYLRTLLRRTLAGETTRVLAISPTNTILLEQMRLYEQNEDGRFEKGNDDAVDSLIAGIQPVAKRHRDLVDAESVSPDLARHR